MRDWANEEFMTPSEVASLLQLSRQTIYNWIDAGTLPCVRVGRRVRVLRSDLTRFIDSGYRPRRDQPAPAAAEASEAGQFWGDPTSAE